MEGRKHTAIKRKVEWVRWLNDTKGAKDFQYSASNNAAQQARAASQEKSWERQFVVVPRH